MQSMKPFNILAVISLILLGCFGAIQFFNKQDALSFGKIFLKTHNATVESLDCGVPSLSFAVIDRSTRFCTFKATRGQIQVLVRNLNFRPVNPVKPSIEESIKNEDEYERQKTKGVVEPAVIWKIHDEITSSFTESNICWAVLGIKNRSELELYGTIDGNKSEFSSTFNIFYNKKINTGCFRFVSMDGKIS
jgi:hypothetical protein